MRKQNRIFSLFVMATFLLSSCTNTEYQSETYQKLDYAETVFQAHLAHPLSDGEGLFLEMIDEVTGIALNPTRFRMDEIGSGEYELKMPLAIGSVVRYRYVRSGSDDTIEKDAEGQDVLYRLYKVDEPGQVVDFISGWDGQPYSGLTGEISGYIFDLKTEAPLGEILVSVNGLQTYTSFDGFYKFEHVPLGQYPLVALHPDGLYEVFQQEAIVAENSVTPASFGMQPAKLVNITFDVSVPVETDAKAVVRLLGNNYHLGYSFAELSDGTSVFASLAPTLEKSGEYHYSATLQLPAGMDLRYKYSLGDGFINAEHGEDGNFRVRQLIIPEKDMIVRDKVDSWYSSGTAPVKFQVTVPSNTPSGDAVSIQFKPYAWMQAIPMWNVGENQWSYTLYGPLEYLNHSQYRFCRNGLCGIADDAITHGINATGYQLDLDNGTPLIIKYHVDQWFGLNPPEYAVQNVGADNSLLIEGFEFASSFDRPWISYVDKGLIDAAVNGGKWVFFDSSWTFEEDGRAGYLPTINISSMDILHIMNLSNDAGLNFALYPQITAREGLDSYWSKSNLSYSWWQRWFDSYERFVLNYADFAAQHGINTIIIGGESVSPAFPNGMLYNGTYANTPYNIAERWSDLVENIRSRYNGQIGFALPYSTNLAQAPKVVSSVDFIYLEMSSSLSTTTEPTVNDLRTQLSSIFDTQVYKLYEEYQKPIIVAADYYAINGSASDCQNLGSSCRYLYENSDVTRLPIDSKEQADIYSAILQEVITRPWFVGFVSKGFQPALAVEDASNSVRGKPALKVLSTFFN